MKVKDLKSIFFLSENKSIYFESFQMNQHNGNPPILFQLQNIPEQNDYFHIKANGTTANHRDDRLKHGQSDINKEKTKTQNIEEFNESNKERE